MTAKAVGTAFNAALGRGWFCADVADLERVRQGWVDAQLDLARELGIEPPTLTRHLDNLERNGLVVRRRSDADGGRCGSSDEAGEEAHQRMRPP